MVVKMSSPEMKTTAAEKALDLTKPKKCADLPSTPSMDVLEKRFLMSHYAGVHHPRSMASEFSPTLPESAATEARHFSHQLVPHLPSAAQMRLLPPYEWTHHQGPPANFHHQMIVRPPVIHAMPKTPAEIAAPNLNLMMAFPKRECHEEENSNHCRNMSDHADSTVRTSPSVSSSESDSMDFCKSHEMKVKRPFKVYAKELTNFPMDFDNPEEYELYKAQVLERIVQSSKITNKNMRRSSACSVEDKHNDPAYRERRRKNNAAAKRSRDARRAKEDEMAIRCEFLTRNNIKLKQDIAVARDREERLKHELERLNAVLMSYQVAAK